ncbi:hypothetical protein ACIPEN_21550 [Herbaspirillum chlorophenolicum]|uniref:pPIWI-RE three-gene island domain-containing protein n=1 Tax=Herbaspirillum chlorophenolicum TaxID=211589 RepID=A0ABW8F559_9BURK
MRQSKSFVALYADSVLLEESKRGPTQESRDAALVDLCLHFLATYLPDETIDTIPSLLQGHLSGLVPDDASAPLVALRHMASSYCSRLAWRNALTNHDANASRTMYRVSAQAPERQRSTDDAGYLLLSGALNNAAPYEQRAIYYATAGHWISTVRWDKATIGYEVPAIKPREAPMITLKRRAFNPPIPIRWTDLLSTATEVDKREALTTFPKWLPALRLRKRLERVSIEAIGSEMWRDGVLTLSETQHLVGMLSSGKSTLLLALLFLLIRPGYDKRVVVIASDTAAASLLVARLRAHGVLKATVISSIPNRAEHLSAAHWAAGGNESENKLLAAAAMTESLGIACPLEGYQSAERELISQGEMDGEITFVPTLRDKPCHRLVAPGKSKQSKAEILDTRNHRSCPLISMCPVHAQQMSLSDASVIVMTSQALLSMSPDKSVVAENMSFPELFQYTADVVLIDEADSVQQTFDDHCLQDASLLAADSGAFLPEHQRLMANSLQDRLGGQYAKAVTVRWQAAFSRLQGAVALAYHFILRFEKDLSWTTHGQPFTASSILCDLWSTANPEDSEERRGHFEQIAILASSLYSEVADEHDTQSTPQGLTDARLLAAHAFLKPIQRELLERGTDSGESSPLEVIANAMNGGALSMFSTNAQTGQRKLRRKSIPNDDTARSRAIGLALLTNVVLSTFGYLVRNQPAVEDDFKLAPDSIFSTARRFMMHYGAIIPRPLYGTVFGLLFEQGADENAGGALKLVNHLGVGRYLLTNFHRLIQKEGQAGPHVLLMSGTSWAGGDTADASPRYDVQSPVVGVLRQPTAELQALEKSIYEFVSLGDTPISVSGCPSDVRRDNLRRIARLLGQNNPAGTRLEQRWKVLEQSWGVGSLNNRRKALLVVSNYRDARVVANALVTAAGAKHTVYCLVADSVAKADGFAHEQAKEAEAYGQNLVLLPRSRVETFGEAPDGAILIAPIGPISRGHNIVRDDGCAVISTIYFLHRPHPRPDDIQSIVGCVNRFTMEWINKSRPGQESISLAGKTFERKAKFALDDGFALRRAFSIMPDRARTQYSWDLITQLWQTIGRGIRGGVPVYVGFVDERFAPQTFAGNPKAETHASSCLMACMRTLDASMHSQEARDLAFRLYQPFLQGLQQLFPSAKRG